jgi:hypothetical protein
MSSNFQREISGAVLGEQKKLDHFFGVKKDENSVEFVNWAFDGEDKEVLKNLFCGKCNVV